MELILDIGKKLLVTIPPVISLLYIWTVLLKEKINLKNIRNYIIMIIFIIMVSINYFLLNIYTRSLVIVTLSLIVVHLLFKREIYNTIITTIYSYGIFICSDIIFALIMTLIFKVDSQTAVTNFFGTMFTNISVTIIAISIINIRLIQKVYKKIIYYMSNLLDIYVLEIMFIIMLFFNIYLGMPYYDVKLGETILVHLSFLMLCIFIFFAYCQNKNKFLKTNDKYNTTLKSLREYEDLVSLYRLNNHENKNQLMTIRGMTRNKQVISYINKILNTQIKDNHRILNKVNKIPEGGLKGLVYTKLMIMEEKKIKYNIDISREIKTSALIKIGDKMILEICKVIGVFLDNAIEYVEGKKEYNIWISLYKKESKMIIEISNNISEEIEIEKINEIGYSTKGEGHGYGLDLVSKIIRKNKNLENKRRINDDIFTQVLEIKGVV